MDIIPTLFSIALFPFTSQTDFLFIPFMLSFILALFMLFARMLRGDF